MWEYRSVLGVMLYNILTLPGVSIHFVCGQPLGNVSTLILQKSEVFFANHFRQPHIKLIELYEAVENVLEVQ